MHSSTISHETGQETTPTFSPSNILLHFSGLFSLIYSQLKPSYPLNLKSGSSWHRTVVSSVSLDSSSEDAVFCSSRSSSLPSSSVSVSVCSVTTASSFEVTTSVVLSTAPTCVSSEPSASWVVLVKTTSSSEVVLFPITLLSVAFLRAASTFDSCSAMHSSTISHETGQETTPTFSPSNILLHFSGLFSLIYSQLKPSYPLNLKSGSSWQTLESSSLMVTFATTLEASSLNDESVVAKLLPSSTSVATVSLEDTSWSLSSPSRPSSSSNSFSNTPPTPSSNASNISSSNFSAVSSSTVPCSRADSNSLSISFSSSKSSFCSDAESCSSAIASALFSVVVSSVGDTTTSFFRFCSAMHSSTISQDTGQDESPTFTPWCFLSHLSGLFSLMYAQSKPSYPLYSKSGSSWHRTDSSSVSEAASISSPSFGWDSSMPFSSSSATAALTLPLPPLTKSSLRASSIFSSNFSAMSSSSSCWSSFSSVAETASSSLSSSSTSSSVPVTSSSWALPKSSSSSIPFSTCSFAATSTTSSCSSGMKASSSSAILTANSSSSTVSIPLAFFLSTFSSPLSSSSSSCTPSSSTTIVSLFVPCLLLSFNNCSISSSSNFNPSCSVTVSISSSPSQRPQLLLQTSFTFNIFSPSSTPSSSLSTIRTSESTSHFDSSSPTKSTHVWLYTGWINVGSSWQSVVACVNDDKSSMDEVDEGGAVSCCSPLSLTSDDASMMGSISTNWSAAAVELLLLPFFVVEAILIVTSSSSSSPPLLVRFIREAAITSSSATTVVLFWNASSSTWVDSSTTTLSSVSPSIFSISLSFVVSLLSNNLTSSDLPAVPFTSSGASFVAVDAKSSSSSSSPHCSSSLLFVNVNLRNSFNSLDDSLDAAYCCCCCCEGV